MEDGYINSECAHLGVSTLILMYPRHFFRCRITSLNLIVEIYSVHSSSIYTFRTQHKFCTVIENKKPNNHRMNQVLFYKSRVVFLKCEGIWDYSYGEMYWYKHYYMQSDTHKIPPELITTSHYRKQPRWDVQHKKLLPCFTLQLYLNVNAAGKLKKQTYSKSEF